MQVNDSSNEQIDLTNLFENQVKIYEYKYFNNIEEIGRGAFGVVYRAKWKNNEQYLALKSFKNLDDAGVRELVREVIINTIGL